MAQLGRLAFFATVSLGVFALVQGRNTAEAKTAYLKVENGSVIVSYDHGDNYSLKVYEPRWYPYDARFHRDPGSHRYLRRRLGDPYFGTPYRWIPRY